MEHYKIWVEYSKHNSVNDFIKVCSYIVSFNDMFRLSYEPNCS